MKVYVFGIVFDEVNRDSFECATLWCNGSVKENYKENQMIFSSIDDAVFMMQCLHKEGHMIIYSSSVDAWEEAE